ncbi:MAG TPA: SDR family oxidoreductase [Polyangia bacterium]|jgi:NAD(P)-dependent dehydrogenase (short-subunit alcohol dehydrogenase family)
MNMTNTLQGKSALITGGSQGLGRALGQALAVAGARVVLVARAAGPLADAVAVIRAAGGQAHAVAADVADLDQTAAIAGQAAALVGPIELLINNASTLGPQPLRLLLDTDCEDLSRALAVNLVGPFRLTKALVGAMVLRGGGTVVNVSSDAAVEAYPRWGAYGASKAALDHLTRIWAAELSGTGVRVLAVDPGEMDTRMHADAMPEADRAALADPARVAARIVDLLRDPAGVASGSRLSVAAATEGR